jgi:hypothetical protein
MDPARFVAPTFGAPAKEPGNKYAFWYFDPAPIPRELDLTMSTVYALSEADAALGHLQGLGHLVRDPMLGRPPG